MKFLKELLFSVGGFTFWFCDVIHQRVIFPDYVDYAWHKLFCEPIYLRHRKIKERIKR